MYIINKILCVTDFRKQLVFIFCIWKYWWTLIGNVIFNPSQYSSNCLWICFVWPSVCSILSVRECSKIAMQLIYAMEFYLRWHVEYWKWSMYICVFIVCVQGTQKNSAAHWFQWKNRFECIVMLLHCFKHSKIDIH